MRNAVTESLLSAQEAAMLVRSVAEAQDRAAFARLFQHFAPRLKSYMRRLGANEGEAEELLQDTFLSVWRKASSFNAEAASVSTWLFAIARNRRIDVLRRSRHVEIQPDDPDLSPAPAPMADDVVNAGQRDRLVRQAMADLPAEQAEVIRLSFYESLSHAEIADVLGLPLGTVKSRLRLAFNRVRSALETGRAEGEGHGDLI